MLTRTTFAATPSRLKAISTSPRPVRLLGKPLNDQLPCADYPTLERHHVMRNHGRDEQSQNLKCVECSKSISDRFTFQ